MSFKTGILNLFQTEGQIHIRLSARGSQAYQSGQFIETT
jgi:hypothetical protein